ncbi:hypothetical protein TPHA_0H00100 [Tetrapisispora phaffii CBS 4417]|uniref:Uncharacterized protein n=1 Tax=Tetrapisispora phaffii (strain ATCC 24235 / CBS 4417 / NBRC 1672 / NRRL Y-8282 / UCD 70-5) TaxID=1071381 RepID=G8BWR7_TETPH|nr:hypothetical protein TPHA_0H00100 [Tetrapisispora phaffii CBS 4417]CCE64221.1 hypothetical protein TPHA_0H00100 [Tetrapisispora phaffii CBS 4417]
MNKIVAVRRVLYSIICMMLLCSLVVTVNYNYANVAYIAEPFGLNLMGRPLMNTTRKIAFVSRHKGTVNDFQYVEKNLKLENVDYLLYYGIDFKEIGTNETMAREICKEHDTVVVSDCLSDGWEFIKSKDIGCSNIVFIVSTRYDACIQPEDKEAFNKDFNNALNREDGCKLTIIPNNAFEIPYMKYHKIQLKEDYPLIRPFGNAESDAIDIEKESDYPPCLIINRFEANTNLLMRKMKENMDYVCKVMPRYYGGPGTLSKYDSIVVDLPYQVSVMKMWENIAAGVLIAIPSPSFFKELRKDGDYRGARLSKAAEIGGQDWFKNIDLYLPDFEKCFIQFDSWSALEIILTEQKYKNNIGFCKNLMKEQRAESLQKWRDLFNAMD